MNIIMTGHKGFIGSQLQDKLRQMNWSIKGYDKDLWYPSRYINDKPDMIYHLGALAGIGTCQKLPQQCVKLNVESTLLWGRKAKSMEAQIIFASSAAVENLASFYAVSKMAAEMFLKSIPGLDYSILRFSNVYGPGSLHKSSAVAQMIKDGLREQTVFVHGNGRQTRDFVYVDDACQACLEAPEGTWRINTDRQTRLLDLAGMIANKLDAEVKMVESSREEVPPKVSNVPRWEIYGGYTELEYGLDKTIEYFRDLLK